MSKKLEFGSNYEPYIEINKILPTETEVRGAKWISWGDNNIYPIYLYELYKDVATLRTIINTVCDYVVGDGVETSNNVMLNEEDLESLVYDIALSYAIYGGFAIQVCRNAYGKVCKLIVLDLRWVRTDKDNKWFYYSEDFGKRTYGRCKCLCYPAYDKTLKQDVSIYLYKNEKFNVYPQPVHIASIIPCELERKVNDYHFNSICNGFSGSLLVNMNNGVPEEEQQNEIVEAFQEKFTGSENAGRVVVSFNESKENAAELTPLNPTDFSEKYKALIERATQQIFTSWRCSKKLCGMPEDGIGFNSQEFSDEFKLFQRTVISSIQRLITTTIKKLFEGDVDVNIKPFNIQFDTTKIDN